MKIVSYICALELKKLNRILYPSDFTLVLSPMQNKKNNSLWASITGMHCPNCREGKLFETSTFSFEKPFDMPDRCSTCNQNFNPEPGFYFGAMFVSYILWGWFSILFCLALVFIYDWTVMQAFLLLLVISAIFFVWLFRISRSIWIHIVIKYNSYKAKT